jgi:hypothetical protein
MSADERETNCIIQVRAYSVKAIRILTTHKK